MNTRGPNQNHQRRVDPNMYTNPNQYNHTPTATTNPRFIIGQPRPNHYQLSQPTHNIADMKNNSHMPNMSHAQIQMVQHIPPRPAQVYLPTPPYPNTNHTTYFAQYSPQQASQTVLMAPYMQNYPANPPTNSMFYSTTPSRPIQMSNIQQGPPNPPVANMSNAQTTHGQSLIVQPQTMDIPTNSQPLQVPQQPSATSIPDRPRRRTAALKIIDPHTGNEIDLNPAQQSAPSADELEKMKVQSQFQSQVQSAVKKDDAKVSDNSQSSEGKEKVCNEFQTQVKKLLSESSSPTKTDGVEEVISKSEESSATIIGCQNTELKESETITSTNLNSKDAVVTCIDQENSDSLRNTVLLENSISTELELPSLSSEVTNNVEDSSSAKKLSTTEEESLKPVKSKKNKNKKKKGVEPQKNVIKDSTDNTIVTSSIKAVDNVVEKPNDNVTENNSNSTDSSTIQNKENENENCLSKVQEEVKKAEELLPSHEIKNNGIKHESAETSIPKLPSYIEKLPYAQDQWSYTNQSGQKVYSRAFLMQLGNEVLCQKKPDILRNWGHITRSANASQYNNAIGSSGASGMPIARSQSASATGFMPAYFKPGGSSQRGGMAMMSGTKRNSSQGKTASKSSKPNTIHMSLSLREEVKLNQTENAWVPTAVKKASKNDSAKNKNEEELKTEDVHKNVRSILNKITPDNKDALTESFKSLPIDTYDRLEKTIDLVFEKAIEEQSFAPLYASLCQAMQGLQVNYDNGTKTTSFKKLIISKCQSLFELDKAQEMDSAKRLSEINSCKDPEKKKELQMEFEDNERRLRKRSVGNCRFIGELFKQKILTPNIMLYCIVNLVTKHDEEPLECLCNLLKTVGKELEQAYSLNETFDKLRALTSKEMKSKIPSRIRFMIQDVIDLRKDKWVPRRLDNKPKLINEIENDAKNEAMEQSIALSSYNNRSEKTRDNHRDDKYRTGGGDNKNRRNETEWNIVQNTKYKQQNYTIDQTKLQGLQGLKEQSSVSLGPSSKWSFTSNSSGGKNSSFTSNNMYAPLNDDKKSSNSQLMSNKNTPRKPMISETEERQRMMSGVASMMPQFAQPSTTLNTTATSSQTSKEVEESAGSVEELDPETQNKINRQCTNIIQEYEEMHNIDDVVYSLKDDEKSAIRTRHEEFVKCMCLMTLELKPKCRTEAGKMFSELLSKNVLTMTAITHGIDAVLKDWNDYLVDYPNFFSYIAAIIAPLLISKTASFDFVNLKDACKSICPDNSCKFFIEVLSTILSSKETQDIKEQGGILWIYNKWRKSEPLSLDVFVPTNKLNENFSNDRIGVFLLSIAMYDKMKKTDSKLLYDIMHSWITDNIKTEIIDCPQFVRSLTIANVIACLGPNYSFDEFFDHVYIKLLTCYIRSKPWPAAEIQAREVQCLYGIQIMSAALEYPAGMVLKLFHKLYQDSVISKESFDMWKTDDGFKAGFDEDLETKTMAVVVLNSFFISLAANDSDEEETIDP